MNIINATLLLAHFLITSNISCVLCVPMSMYFMIFSWCFKFTLCKHVRLSYVFLINLLTYLLTVYVFDGDKLIIVCTFWRICAFNKTRMC